MRAKQWTTWRWLLAASLGLTGCQQCPVVPGGSGTPGAINVVSVGPSPARVALQVFTADGAPVFDVPVLAPPGTVQPTPPKPQLVGVQPTDCQGTGVTITLDHAAPSGGIGLEFLATPEGRVQVHTTGVAIGQAKVPLRVTPRSVGPVRIAYRARGQACALERDCPFVQIQVTESAVDGQCLPCEVGGPPTTPPAPQLVSACDDGAFFIEARLGSRTPCADLPERLRAVFTGPLATGNGPERDLAEALCSWGDVPGCGRSCATPDAPVRLLPGFTPEVSIEPVLAPRPEDPAGALRFYRLRMRVKPTGGAALPVAIAADSQCDLNARLRAAVDRVVADWQAAEGAGNLACLPFADPEQRCDGAAPEFALAVGQECPIRPSQSGATATPEMLSWHLDRFRERADVGLDALPTGGRVALIDTGIDPAIRSAKVQVDEADDRFTDAATNAARLGHGTAMALLIQQLAPDVPIHGLRIFDADGITTTARLAQALEHALYNLPGVDPLLINLSLGWPGEFSLPFTPPGRVRQANGANWADQACTAGRDDGVGEVVRYLLARAQDSARRSVTVVAASGNLAPGTGDLEARQRALRGTDCTDAVARLADPIAFDAWCRADGAGQGDPAARAPLPHLPAGLGLGGARGLDDLTLAPGLYRMRNRRTGQCAPTPLAVAVGALDPRDLPAHYTAEAAGDELPGVVAPGAHVYFGSQALPAATALAACPSAPTLGLASPGIVTGTSASAALVTGYLARLVGAQQGGLPKGEAGTRSHLGLLRALGRAAGFPAQQDRFRRPTLCRLTAAAAAVAAGDVPCTAALRCAATGDGSGDCANADVPAACHLDACQGTDALAAPTLPAVLMPPACLTATAGQGQLEPPPCTDDACLTAHERGRIGPQPDEPICPECSARLTDKILARIRIEFGAQFKYTEYTLSNLRVVFVLDGKVLSVPVDLGTSKPKAGWTTEISGVALNPVSADQAAWKARGQVWFAATVADKAGTQPWSHLEPMRLDPAF